MLYGEILAKISVSTARERFSEVVELAQSEPVELEHLGRRAAFLVSPGQNDEMLEAFEEAQDVAPFAVALAEAEDHIPWKQVKSDLGWT